MSAPGLVLVLALGCFSWISCRASEYSVPGSRLQLSPHEETAARLVELFSEWMKEAKMCSSNLRRLAGELESVREKCNAVETVANTVAVTGGVVALAASPFTGGASLAVAGAVAGGLGAGTAVVTMVTRGIENFKASGHMEQVKKADQRCNEITKEIQDLFVKMRSGSPNSNENEMRNYVLKEILRGMLIQFDINEGKAMKDFDKVFTSENLADLLNNPLPGLLAALSVKSSGEANADQKKSPFLGIFAALSFLPNAIDNWKSLIEKNYETEVTKSIRKAAEMVDEKVKELSDNLSLMEKIVQDMVYKQQSSTG